MKIICRSRQTGRTEELIRECAQYRYALIVCPTGEQAHYVLKKSMDMGLNIPMPISFREFVDGRFYSKYIDAFLFDNLDSSLQIYARGVPVTSVVFEANDNKKEIAYGTTKTIVTEDKV